MRKRTGAARRASASEARRWWRISEQDWYKVVMAVLSLVAAVFGVVFAVRQVWPHAEPPRPVKNNYAILLDRSATMGATLSDKSKLENATDAIGHAVARSDSETTARGLWYFGGACGQVDEKVNLRADNASRIRAALDRSPAANGKRPLVQALDDAVTALANVPVQ